MSIKASMKTLSGVLNSMDSIINLEPLEESLQWNYKWDKLKIFLSTAI